MANKHVRRKLRTPFIERLEDRLALAVYTVDSALDVESSTDGVLTLREAIILANQDSAQDTIRFAISGGPSVITLQSALPTLSESVIINGWSQNGSDDPSAPTVELSGEGLTGSEDGLVITGQGVSILGLVIRDFGGYGVRIESLVPGGAGSATLEGNFIGTDVTGLLRRSNSLGGVLIQDSSVNVIGGVGAYRGNVISGNGGAGVTIRGSGEIQIDPSTAWDLPSLLSGSGNENSATGNRVFGNVIGLSADGSGPLGNASHGVWLDRAGGNVIGGFAPGEGNTISGNGRTMGLEGAEDLDAQSNADGIRVTGAALDLNAPVDSTEAAWNMISGNRIGVDATGMVSFGVGGVSLLGNTGSGIQLGDLSESLAIRANGGSADLRMGPKHTLIGVLPTSEGALGASNVIGGNDGDGVRVDGPGVRYDDSSNPTLPLTLNAVIAGNMIGVNAAGSGALGNQGSGVRLLAGAQLNQVGGSIVAERNIISGNGENGVAIVGTSELVSRSVDGDAGAAASYDVVASPPVIEADGDDHLTLTEIIESTGSIGQAVYTSVVRYLRDPLFPGELVSLRTQANLLQGNYIGTGSSGLSAIANGASGVLVSQGAYLSVIGSYYVLIPGPTPDSVAGSGNVISGNGRHGVEVRGVLSFTSGGLISGPDGEDIDPDTSAIYLEGNLIGLGADGEAVVGNVGSGVVVTEGARGVVVGYGVTDDPALLDAPLPEGVSYVDVARNVISGNGGDGVSITGTDKDVGELPDPIDWYAGVTVDIQVSGNYIGSSATGDQAVGNVGSGVVVGQGARSIRVGGVLSNVDSTLPTRNLIVGNGQHGVLIHDTSPPAQFPDRPGVMWLHYQVPGSIFVSGNLIGVNRDGVAMGNGGDGVALVNVDGAEVAGLSFGVGNVISGNAGAGVTLSGAGTTRNIITGNYVGVNPLAVKELYASPDLGAAPIGNGMGGIILEDGAHDNRLTSFISTAKANYNLANIFGAGFLSLDAYHDALARFNADSFEVPGVIDPFNFMIVGEPGNLEVVTTPITMRLLCVRNVVQGSNGPGVLLTGAGTSGNRVQSVYIGVDPMGAPRFSATGAPILGNLGSGIVETNGANGNFIGNDFIDEEFPSHRATLNAAGTGASISGDPGDSVNLTLTGEQAALARRNIVAVDGAASYQPWARGGEAIVGNFANGPYALTAGGALVLSSGAPESLGPNSYSWEINGDGQFDDAEGASPTISWSQWLGLGLSDSLGDYPVWIRVTDALGNIGHSQAVISIVNSAPAGLPGGPYEVAFGGSIVLDASGSSDPNVGQTLTYEWDIDDDGEFDDATGVSPIVAWSTLASLGLTDPGQVSNVRVRVSDGLESTVSAPTTLTILNTAPTALPGGPYEVAFGGSIVLDASGSIDSDVSQTLTYAWDIDDDGEFDDALGVSPTVAWSTLAYLGLTEPDQVSHVRVRVSDGFDATESLATTLTILNAAPAASSGGPYDVAFGGSIVLDASGSSDPNVGQTLTYEWDFGDDGEFDDATGVSPTVTWSTLASLGLTDPGQVSNVRVRVSDGLVSTVSAPTTLTILNTAPAASSGGPYEVAFGGSIVLDASGSSDPNVGQTLTYEWDFGDDGEFDDAVGLSPTVTWSTLASLGLTDPGQVSNVRVRVSDGLESTVSAATTLTILNTEPTASAGGPYVVSEGGSLHLDASASVDPDVGQSLSYTWDVNGDGVYGDATGVAPTLNWAALAALGVGDGPSGFSVRVRVFDGLATTTSSAGSLTVQNAAPTAHIEIPATPIVRGAPISVTISASDASAADQAATFTYYIDWNNDGIDDEVVAGAGSGVAVSHVFAAAGEQTIAVKAVDKDGGVSASATSLVSVVAYAQVGGDLYIGGSSGDDFYGFWGLGGYDIGVVVNDIDDFRVDGVTGQIYLFMQDGDDTVTTNWGVNGFHFTVDMGLGANIFASVSGGGNTFLYYGGSGVDQFFLNAGSNNSVVFHGGGGDDVFLDVSGDASNAFTVHGGEGNDGAAVGPGAAYLEGDNGNDMLISFGGGATILGGAGDDFLVGGPQLGFLDGGSGSDLLVAGMLVYLPTITDGYLPIWAEWGSSGNSFATRVAHISGTPGGLNGDYYITPGSTALDNGAVDTILGGADADWLVYNFAQDLAPDYSAGEDGRLDPSGP